MYSAGIQLDPIYHVAVNLTQVFSGLWVASSNLQDAARLLSIAAFELS